MSSFRLHIKSSVESTEVDILTSLAELIRLVHEGMLVIHKSLVHPNFRDFLKISTPLEATLHKKGTIIYVTLCTAV